MREVSGCAMRGARRGECLSDRKSGISHLNRYQRGRQDRLRRRMGKLMEDGHEALKAPLEMW
jgi:hypothetical protein